MIQEHNDSISDSSNISAVSIPINRFVPKEQTTDQKIAKRTEQVTAKA